ncbi:MAG: hypothetical protein IJB56_02810 [Alistipes sp.]|nr:hypothetical protein [Alistipes sp.]
MASISQRNSKGAGVISSLFNTYIFYALSYMAMGLFGSLIIGTIVA